MINGIIPTSPFQNLKKNITLETFGIFESDFGCGLHRQLIYLTCKRKQTCYATQTFIFFMYIQLNIYELRYPERPYFK